MEQVCKSCTHNVHISASDIANMLDDAVQNGIDLVSEEVYQERLGICRNCPSLQYGTTCMHSGSLVEYRAKIPESKCPKPNDRRW
ncbi:hypothetical protein [Lederbergia graminis]|uniref:(2Fe-2S)-binding protein n=1 Tax=Lederbergia graminis TaxID=735518 RepID=A0ABW0LLX7_9BACI|nr:hypothetical protein [Paenibacillus bovis]HLU23808.1 hypothetical protein [Bacillaceae bacterium]